MRVLHHVQVSCPAGEEDAARGFWSGCLGLTEVDKPAELARAAPAALTRRVWARNPR